MNRSVIVMLSVAALTGFASVASAQAKIGVVSTNRLMTDAPQAKAANDAIRAEFAPRDGRSLRWVLRSSGEEKLRRIMRTYAIIAVPRNARAMVIAS